MKKTMIGIAAAMFVAGSIFSSCSSPEQKEEHAEKKVEDAKADVKDAKQDLAEAQQGSNISEYQKFKNDANEEINNNDRKIAELRVELKNEKADARVKDEKKIDELQRRNHELKDRLEAYHDDGKSNWQQFKTEFKHDLDELGQSFKDFTVRNTK